MSVIYVKNKHNQTRTFDSAIWNKLPVKKNGSRYGWQQLTEVPEEVKNLHSTKVLTEKPETKIEDAKPKTVNEVIKLINAAKSAAAVDHIVGSDTRATVLKKAEHKKSTFS